MSDVEGLAAACSAATQHVEQTTKGLVVPSSWRGRAARAAGTQWAATLAEVNRALAEVDQVVARAASETAKA